ncbi:MAG: CvpA family protein [Clostridia bacterium]|nr:CvpA family protein [Clostridia bacterium]
MAYILDGAIILILIVSVALGYRRGFIRSVVQLVGLIAAFVLAFSFSATLAGVVFDKFASQPLQESIAEALQENATSSASEQVETVLDALPEFLVNTLHADEAAKAALDGLSQKMNESAPALAETVVVDILRPLAVALLRFVLFLLLFLVLMIAVKLITKLIKPITKLPLIRQTDGLLGAAVGLLKGVLFILVAVTIMQLLAPSEILIKPEDLSGSFLANWIAEHNPIAAGLSL